MKKTAAITSIFWLTFILSLFFSFSLHAQTKAKIENVDFFAESNKIVITYDIAGSQPGETFNIWILVKTVSGKILSAKTTSGDIGKGIAGGSGKRIEWSYALDNVVIEEDIGIEVLASLEAAVKPTEEKVEPAPAKTTEPAKQNVGGRNVHVGVALALSAVLPGLGKTYAKGHGAAWMWGVVGYGMVAGSVLLNHAAYDNLEIYHTSIASDRDDYYNKAKLQSIGSYVCFGSAAIIWAAELISSGVQAGKAKKNPGRVQINGGFDNQAGVPVLGLTYKF